MDQQSVDTALHAIWTDQEEFNALFKRPLSTFEDRSKVTKEMVLAMMAESVELLNTINWKTHRRETRLENRAHTVTELVDIFKYWLTIAQAWGVTVEVFLNAYWEKSAVCRQRYAEE